MICWIRDRNATKAQFDTLNNRVSLQISPVSVRRLAFLPTLIRPAAVVAVAEAVAAARTYTYYMYVEEFSQARPAASDYAR